MPRVKLIRHGLDDNGNDHWGFPVYRWGVCPHPRLALRFDPRYNLPLWMYCRACGAAYIHRYWGMSLQEIVEWRERAAKLAEELLWD
jgi:hypothetical protein